MTGKIVKRDLPPSPKQRTFRPVVTPDGQLRAGGCTLANLEMGPDGPLLVRKDRYKRRCAARGTEDVRVWLREVVEVVEEWGRDQGSRPLGDCEVND